MKLCDEIIEFVWKYRSDRYEENLKDPSLERIIDRAYMDLERGISGALRHNLLRTNTRPLVFSFGPVVPIATINKLLKGSVDEIMS